MKTDMTKGNPLKLMVGFAIPLFLSSLFQQFYNLADTAIVGHILGDHSLSAVGAVGSIYNLITSLCFGMTNGFSIMISQYFGSQDEKRMKKGIALTVELSLTIAIFMTVFCTLFLKNFMRLIHVSDTLFDDGYTYISIIVVCLSVTVFYNMLSAVLRALGNSKIPLIFLIISSILNIVLDIWFISGLNMGIAGAAYATVLAQFLSGVMCMVYILRFCPELLPEKQYYRPDGEMIFSLLSSGFAMAMMYAIVNMGSLILQSGINGLGDDTVAAHITARKFSELGFMPISTLSGTATTFASQNYGAGKKDRVMQGVKITVLAGFVWAIIGTILVYTLGGAMVHLLTGSDNPQIIHVATTYLKINLPFYFPLVALCIIRSTLQGIDKKGITVVASAMEMLGKFITVMFFVKPFGYTAICFCEPVTWVICCIPVTWAFIHTMRKKEGIS